MMYLLMMLTLVFKFYFPNQGFRKLRIFKPTGLLEFLHNMERALWRQKNREFPQMFCNYFLYNLFKFESSNCLYSFITFRALKIA